MGFIGNTALLKVRPCIKKQCLSHFKLLQLVGQKPPSLFSIHTVCLFLHSSLHGQLNKAHQLHIQFNLVMLTSILLTHLNTSEPCLNQNPYVSNVPQFYLLALLMQLKTEIWDYLCLKKINAQITVGWAAIFSPLSTVLLHPSTIKQISLSVERTKCTRANQNIHKHYQSRHFHQKLKPLPLHGTLSVWHTINLLILYASRTIFKRCKHITGSSIQYETPHKYQVHRKLTCKYFSV